MEELKPEDPVGVNKDSFLILDALPVEYDSSVKAMEWMKNRRRSTLILEDDEQNKELMEVVALPMTHADRFGKSGIRPPKGVLIWTFWSCKNTLARACEAQTKATLLKLAGP